MVIFGLFGTNKRSSRHSNPLLNKEKDILDELMGLDTDINIPIDNNSNPLDTSSFHLDSVINRLRDKRSINYNEALLTSLYAQVEFMRQESLEKNQVIKMLLNNPTRCINNNDEITMHNSTINKSNRLDSDINQSMDQSNESVFSQQETENCILTNQTDQLEEIRRLKKIEYYHNRTTNDENFGAWEKYTMGFGYLD